jgi:uncharacterized protein (TIGR00730 family)
MKSICVFCGSKTGNTIHLQDAALQFAKTLVHHNLTLIYGGAQAGLMGLIADQVLKEGGRVIGVMPKSLTAVEYVHHQLTELHIVDSMSERKMKMAELSDGFVALPGGIGTLDELFEVWTWRHLGLHEKPIGLLNVEGFYDPLIAHIERMVQEGFLSDSTKEKLLVETESEALVQKFLRK